MNKRLLILLIFVIVVWALIWYLAPCDREDTCPDYYSRSNISNESIIPKEEFKCNKPYFEYKSNDCCLDFNDNKICDRDEQICPFSCDDGNKCTDDYCSVETNYECRHAPIANCCGNGVCEPNENYESCPKDCESPPTPGIISSIALPETAAIRIASWNIENFGATKASDPERMRVIAGILKDYDLIAVQEISNIVEKSDPGCPRNEGKCPINKNCDRIRNALEKYLNQEYGLNYSFVFSPQVKDERYLYIYNTYKVDLISPAELVDDPEDSTPICALKPDNTGKMVRQPFKGYFKAGSFDFTLLTAHTSPSINLDELEGLEYFYRQVENEGESDIIVLGDLNADCSYLKLSEDISFRRPEYIWVVNNTSDTTVSKTDCAYDRFIFKNNTLEDYTGSWGIYKKVPDNVSDHYLIWAEFSTTEDSD